MKWKAGVCVAVLLAAFCFPACAAEDLGGLVASIVALQNSTGKAWPQHLTSGAPKNGTELDVGEYFKYFKHIAPPKGQTLDYVFCGLADGRPRLYWKREGDPALKTCDDLKRSGKETDMNALSSLLVFDDAEDAFFEFLIFSILADKFYLSWHAGYADIAIACTQKAVEDIVNEVNASGFGYKLDEKQIAAARALDVSPVIDASDPEAVTVSVVTFSKWQGFVRVSKRIARSYPHVVLDEKREVLVEYNCGVMF